MSVIEAIAPDHGGHFAENIAFFGRALRNAGVPVGPKTVLQAVEAVELAGIGGRDDLYWTLHAVMITKREHSVLFDQAFRLFWRRRALLEKMMAQLMPEAPARPEEKREEALKRVADALMQDARRPEPPAGEQMELDARMTLSDAEVFRTRDFEQMSAAEIADAKRDVARLALPIDLAPVRRLVAAPRAGLLDPRRSSARVHAGGRSGHRFAVSRSRPASAAAGGDLRHLRLHEPVQPHFPALPACALEDGHDGS